jgi:hypothetical protein
MRPVVRDAELLGDDGGHPCARPGLAAEAVCFRPVCQELRNLRPLLPGQLGDGTRMRMGAQPLVAMFSHGAHPLADGPFGHAEGGGNRLLLPAVALERERTVASQLQPIS